MKKFIISILAAIFITIVIPLAIVEFVPPQNNADSTKPLSAETQSSLIQLTVYNI